ncbi:MAG: hydantoinase B/oxoprolinase family protein [Rhabdochlamydiaceae bacterium]
MSADAIDPVTFEVLTHKLWQITDEMGATLKLVSASPIVSESGDFCTAICTRDGDLVAMGTYITANAWAIRTAIKNIAKTKVDEIEDGDMFIVNDPWLGSLHQSDVIIVAPIFYKDELFCWSGSMAHQLDIGASRPGGFAAATEVYQEGLRLPPMKIVEKGKLNNELFDMILNMVRVKAVGLDLKGQIATSYVCRERITKLCDHYGADVVERVARKGIRQSEAKLRQKLRELPDGVFRQVDYIDHDGLERKLYKVVLAMRKKNDSLFFDFNGTSEQCGGYMNCAISGTWGGVIGAAFPWLCYDIQWNEGVLKPLEVYAPESSLINARVPAAVNFTTTGPLQAVRNVSTICLSRLMACSEKYSENSAAVWQGAQPKVLFGGTNQFGQRYVCNVMDNLTGGGGARAMSDGIDSGGGASGSDPSVPNIETYELDYPMLFIFRRQSVDSGGAGKFRGGVGCEECFIPYDSERLQLTFIARGVDIPSSVGIFGGYPSCKNEGVLVKGAKLSDALRKDLMPSSIDEMGGSKEILPACVDRLIVSKNDAFFFKWNGGGGYGDPLDREPIQVARDVQNGLVSRASASAAYGVAVKRDESSYDSLSTKKKRDRIMVIRAAGNRRASQEKPSEKVFQNLEPFGYCLAIDRSKKVIRCAKCGHVFCRYDRNPKASSSIIEKPLKNCKWPKTGEELVQREYFCPGCFTLFSVDLGLKGSKPLFDIELDLKNTDKKRNNLLKKWQLHTPNQK